MALVRRPAAVAATAAVLVALFVVLRLAAHGWQPGSFVVAGDAFVDPDRAPAELVVARGSTGYDGQFVYRLALDPTTDQLTDRGIRLDNPAYRAQRIGLPAMGWLVDRIPGLPLSVALILVNALALVGVAYAGARLASTYGRAPAWGLLIALSPALLISLSRDLTEPLATLGLVSGLLLWIDRRYAYAVAAFCLGALTRETTLVVLAGMGVWQLLPGVRRTSAERAGRWRRALWLLVPLAVVVGWQAVVHATWGSWPVGSSSGNLGLPVVGVARTIFRGAGSWSALDRTDLLAHFFLFERLLLAAFLLYVGFSLARSRLPAEIRLGWVLAAVLAVSASGWAHDVQFLRAANEAVTVGLLVLLARPGRAARPVLAATGGLAAAVALVHAVAL